MVVVKGPFMSLDASGTLAKTLTATSWKGRAVLRKHAIPSNPKSGLQQGMRAIFKYLAQAYNALSAAQKAKWDDLAAATNITNMNAQIGHNGDRARRNLGWKIDPALTPSGTVDPPTSPTGTPQPSTLVISWTRPAANQGDYTAAVYLSTTSSFTADISNLVAVVDVATVTVTIPNLVTGTTYYFLIRETNENGQLGTLSAEGNGTPT